MMITITIKFYDADDQQTFTETYGYKNQYSEHSSIGVYTISIDEFKRSFEAIVDDMKDVYDVSELTIKII